MVTRQKTACFLLVILSLGCDEDVSPTPKAINHSEGLQKKIAKKPISEPTSEVSFGEELHVSPELTEIENVEGDFATIPIDAMNTLVPPIFDDGNYYFYPRPLYPGTDIPILGGGGKQGLCGNGIKQRNEECDDGGTISGDGCSFDCRLELFGALFDGSDGLADFYRIDPRSGLATLIGPIGFQRVSAMDFSQDGVLYATGERNDDSDTPVLITINIATGTGTEVGPLGGSATGSISDMSFRPSDNVLFAYDANPSNHRIFTIDILTGAATLVGNTGFSEASGNALSFNLEDILYQSQLWTDPNPELNTINQMTGLGTFVLDLLVGDGDDRFSAMDVHPLTGTMFGLLTEGFPATSTKLARFNTNTGAVTIIGPTTTNMDALTWSK